MESFFASRFTRVRNALAAFLSTKDCSFEVYNGESKTADGGEETEVVNVTADRQGKPIVATWRAVRKLSVPAAELTANCADLASLLPTPATSQHQLTEAVPRFHSLYKRILSALDNPSQAGSAAEGISFQTIVLTVRHKHAWAFVRRMELAAFSPYITACELLGTSPHICVGSTLRTLRTGPFTSLPADGEDRIIIDCKVVEMSDVEHRVAWSFDVPHSARASFGGLLSRRDSLQVIPCSKEELCRVLWLCEYKHEAGVTLPAAVVDMGVVEGMQQALNTTPCDPVPLFGPTRDDSIVEETKSDASESVEVLHVQTNQFVRRFTPNLRVGDVCRFPSGSEFPADVMLLWSSSPLETAVSYAGIDATESLRLRKVSPKLKDSLQATCVDVGRSPLTTDAAANAMAADAIPGLCSVCTFQNDELAALCDVCGTILGSSSSSSGSSGNTDVFAAFGSGETGLPIVKRLNEVCSLIPGQSRADGRSKSFLTIEGQRDRIKLSNKQFLPAGSKLIFTELVIGVIVQLPGHCYRDKIGGRFTAVIAKRRRIVSEAAEKAWKSLDSSLKTLEPWTPPGVDPALYEEKTGIRWLPTWTDVPDDGNCLLSAFHMGLSGLLREYPDIRLPVDADFPPDSIVLRKQLFERLAQEEAYTTVVSNMIRLWLELDASVLVSQVEDFFTLPASFQSIIFEANQQAVKAGRAPDEVVQSIVSQYIQLLALPTEVNGKITFVPLGEPELDALARHFQVRLQTVKSDCVKPKEGGGEPVDPRTIRTQNIREHLPADTASPLSARRIVRIVNVSTNHYQVHLPRPST